MQGEEEGLAAVEGTKQAMAQASPPCAQTLTLEGCFSVAFLLRGKVVQAVLAPGRGLCLPRPACSELDPAMSKCGLQ